MPVSRRSGSEIERPERGDPERGESGIAIPRRQRRDDRGQRLARHRRRDGALVEHVGRAVGERTDALGPAQFDAGKGSCLRVAAGRRRCAHERAPARTTGATLGGTGKLETILSPVTARPSTKNRTEENTSELQSLKRNS